MNPSINQNRFIRVILIVVIAVVSTLYLSKKNSKVEALNSDTQQAMKDFIMANPELILQSIQNHQKTKLDDMKAKIRAKINDHKSELEDTNVSPYIGSEHPDVTMVMFYDYYCGYCQRANIVLNELLNQDSKLRIVLKPFPVVSESSEYAAKVALAVYKEYPDKFSIFHNDLMQQTNFTKSAVVNLCSKFDIDYNKIDSEVESKEINDKLMSIRKLATEIDIHGAPSFVIGDKNYPGLLEINRLQDIISKLRAEKTSVK